MDIEDEQKEQTVHICKHFHTSAADLTERYVLLFHFSEIGAVKPLHSADLYSDNYRGPLSYELTVGDWDCGGDFRYHAKNCCEKMGTEPF